MELTRTPYFNGFIIFFLIVCRFLDPLVFGEYPRTMQNIVGDRLPKFTKEEVNMVKGSFDYVGINQYTTYYIYDPPHLTKPKTLCYLLDWNAGFACKMFNFLHFVNIIGIHTHAHVYMFMFHIKYLSTEISFHL